MLLRSKTPNRVVQKRVRHQGRWKVKPIFRFDEKGLYDLDESKFSETDIKKLKAMFEVVETESNKMSFDEMVTNKIKETIAKHDFKKAQEQTLKELEDRKEIETTEEVVEETTEEVKTNPYDSMSEEELRALAKEKKIKSWHVKGVEKLKKELMEVK